MKATQIDEDLQACINLPDSFHYFQRFLSPEAKQRKPLLLGDKLALVGNDPAFAWNLACCYVEANKPMPPPSTGT